MTTKQRARALARSLGAGVSLAALWAAAPALAQQTAGTEARSTDTIVVTARRREEDIQDAPVSVSVISPAVLSNQASVTIQDMEGIVPNIVIDTVAAGPGGAGISIRGISFEDIEKSFDPAVGVLIDDVYIGTNTGQLLNSFDFESVQVLRGPQGTLFGRNTTAGVIAVKRTRPTGEWGIRGTTTVGEYGRFDVGGVLNLPARGALSTKAFYFSQNYDGYVFNVIRNRNEGRIRYQNYGVTFAVEPNDSFDALLTIEQQKDNGGSVLANLARNGVDLICLRVNPAPGVFVNPFAPQRECNRNTEDDLYTSFQEKTSDFDYTQDAVTFSANWDVGPVTLSWVTGWRSSDEIVTQDFDASSFPFFDTVRPQDYQQTSHELRAAGNIGENVDYVVGAYYFTSKYDLAQVTNIGFAVPGAIIQSRQTVDHKSKSTAIFADVDWRLTDRFRLNLGGRYTEDEKSIRNRFTSGTTPFDVRASGSWSKFTPKIGIDYRVSDTVLLYAVASEGYRSGGFNGRAASLFSATTPYQPETVESVEIGAKTEWFDGELILNIAAFTTKYDDKQEESVQPTPPGSPNPQETIVANAASATINGLEVEARWEPVDDLIFNASLGLLDAGYDTFNTRDAAGRLVSLATRTLRRAPEVTWSVSVDWEHDLGPGELEYNLTYRYIDKYATSINPLPGGDIRFNDPRSITDEQTNLSANVGYEIEIDDTREVKLSVYGRNLLDDRGLNATLPVAGLFTFGSGRPPREFGVELTFNF
jgi:iron complex outermembrane recepter protein